MTSTYAETGVVILRVLDIQDSLTRGIRLLVWELVPEAPLPTQKVTDNLRDSGAPHCASFL